jgi:hypothetical protein
VRRAFCVRSARHPMLATQIKHHRARIGLAQNPDDLFFREPLPLIVRPCVRVGL